MNNSLERALRGAPATQQAELARVSAILEGDQVMTKKTTTTRTRTETKTSILSPLEEKVVRMRHGLRAPDSLVLEAMGQDNPETSAKLAEIEQRALSMVGTRQNTAKRDIVNSLKRKSR